MKAMSPCQDPSLPFHSVLTLLNGIVFTLYTCLINTQVEKPCLSNKDG